MSEVRRFPYGSVPVYNPQSLSKEEAIAQFYARQGVYESLLDLLGEERPSHVLIIGTRGMGKTTLLQRVRFGVEDSAQLNCRHLPLCFPEEQYNVTRLHHFLLNTVDALADALELRGDRRTLAQVEAYAAKADKFSAEEAEEDIPKFLMAISGQLQQSFLMLVDNADRLFETIENKEQWRLRELLSSREDLTFFGATTQASEGIYGSDRAFFEFFKIYQLAPLTLEEVRTLLLQLGEAVKDKDGQQGDAKRRVEEWLAADPSRLRTLVQLTGGNPRTIVLLFHLVLDGLEGGAREYLEQLLDQCTPGYKGRIDELPAQAQQVLDALALQWDPATAAELGETTGLETSAVSTQLTRLVRQGLAEKVDPGDSKKALYQVAERFFNIWYLMRASRRVRVKLRWFVEFLRVFYDSPELERVTWERLDRFRREHRGDPCEIENIFAYALASGTDRARFEDYLRRECADREQEWRPVFEAFQLLDLHCLDSQHQDTSSQAEPGRGSAGHAELAVVLRALKAELENAENWRLLDRTLRANPELEAEAELVFRQAVELDSESATSWRKRAEFLRRRAGREEEAEAAFRKALDLDPNQAWAWGHLGKLLQALPNRQEEAEAALRKATDLDSRLAWAWDSLGRLLCQLPNREVEAEAAFRKAIHHDPQAVEPRIQLGVLLTRTLNRQQDAEIVFRGAIEVDPSLVLPRGLLGAMLAKIPNRRNEAEAALRKAIEIDPSVAWAWGLLGALLSQMPSRQEESEYPLRKAIEIDPSLIGAWTGLGTLLSEMPDRLEEAEAAFRNLSEIDPENTWAWIQLGSLLSKLPSRHQEAQLAFKRATELDPNDARTWLALGMFHLGLPEHQVEAESALRKAIELDPNNAQSRLGLGLQSWKRGCEAEAEAAFRKTIELNPSLALGWRVLGLLLSELPMREHEAEAALRKVVDLQPTDPSAWSHLGIFLAKLPCRIDEAGEVFGKSLEIDQQNADTWRKFGLFLACRAGQPARAETAFRKSVQLEPDHTATLRNLGVLLFCEQGKEEEGVQYIRLAQHPDSGDSVSAAVASAILAACVHGSGSVEEALASFTDETRRAGFWDKLLELCQNYAPFGKILGRLCDLVQDRDSSNPQAHLWRALALAQLGDFPRASVALEDALAGDPIALLSWGKKALETFLAAAVRCERVRDCLEVIEKKEWIDAWRPIYEALKAVEAGSGNYLKRVAVEIRQPAQIILRRIAPELPDLAEPNR